MEITPVTDGGGETVTGFQQMDQVWC